MRKELRADAKVSDVRLRAIIETAVDGIIIIDSFGVVLLYSAACERIFGYPASEVIERNIKMLMPPPYRGEHDAYLKKYRETGAAKIIGIGREVIGRRKDGSRFPMDVSVGEAREGKHRAFVGIVRDISERKQIERALAEERDFTSAILDTVGALVVVLDRHGRIVRFNPVCAATTGYTAEEVVGRRVWDLLLIEEETEAAKSVFAELRAGLFPNRSENYWVTKDGLHRRIEWSNTAILDPSGDVRFVIGTGIDVTERHHADRELRELQSELARVSRLSDTGEMAAGIAHELNQPLTAVMNYLEAGRLILEAPEGAAAETLSEMLDKAVGQTLRAGQIIRRLREFVEKGETERSVEDINDLVKEASALALVGSAETGVEFELDMADGLPPVFVDRIQIQQVVLNLLRNAVDAVADSERREITMSTSCVDDDLIRVAVRDTGTGLAAEVSDRLFQPFVTSKPDGMGVGLSICRTIVDAHGGQIGAAENPGGGTIFEFTLPVAPRGGEAGGE